MPVTDPTFRALALEDREGHWELHRGRLRAKPTMTWDHNDQTFELAVQPWKQLDRGQCQVRHNSARLRSQELTFYIPDVFVVPTHFGDHLRDQHDLLEVYDGPALLVAEFWSPSTGDYDVDAKIPENQRRGDLEIWRLHPYDRTLTVWRRQTDGTYTTFQQTGGTIQQFALPGVTIDLDALFD